MKNLLDRAKLFFSKDKEFRAALYSIMGFYPHNIELYRTAFAHKSLEYRSKKTGNKPLNNERLEFLGDAVLETVVSDIVYRHFPNKREGFLTNTRSKIVSRESLGKLAKSLGIDRLIQSQTHSRAHNSYLAGNSFEALMGAIYLDRGFAYAFRFVEKRIIGAALDLEGVAHKEVNFKSKLLEWSQKNRIRLDFKESHVGSNNGNQPSFLTTIVIEGIYAGEGKGFSKKESHQAASKDALTRLRREQHFLDSVYRAKEKRTAMAQDECFGLPKIDEIEAEIAKPRAKSEKPERQKRERNERPERQERKNTPRAEKQDAPKTEPKPRRENQPKTETKTEVKAENKAENQPKERRQKAEKGEAKAERSQQRPAPKREAQEAVRAEQSAQQEEAAAPAPQAAVLGLLAQLAQAAPATDVAEDAAQKNANESQKTLPKKEIVVVEDLETEAIAVAQVAEETSLPTPSAESDSADAIPETAASPREVLETADADGAVEEAQDAETPTEGAPKKKKSRRKGKRQSAAEFTNTTPPPAEQSHRAEKAERRVKEEKERRAIEKARQDLLPEGEESETTSDTSTDHNEPQRERRNERRRNKNNNSRRKNARNAAESEPSAEDIKQREALIAAAEAAAYDDN